MIDRFERFSYGISEMSKYWHKLTTDEMEKKGLKGPHSVYILTMHHHPEGLTATQLCGLCGKDKADVSRMMSILEKKGFVKKESVHNNHYRATFTLTEQGKDVAEFIRKRAGLAVELAGKDLTEEQRVVFYEAMESIATNLKELSKEGLPEE